jgi:hypothetical protein
LSDLVVLSLQRVGSHLAGVGQPFFEAHLQPFFVARGGGLVDWGVESAP